MSKIKIARRYARALFELAVEQGRLEPVRKDLRAIEKMISEMPELERFLTDPLLTTERRSVAIQEIFSDRVDPLVLLAIRFVEHKDRLNLLQPICAVFQEFYDEHKNILRVRIVAAAPMDSDQQAAIDSRLRARYNQEVRSSVRVESELLGGFKLIVEDNVLDFSLATQLNRLRRAIICA